MNEAGSRAGLAVRLRQSSPIPLDVEFECPAGEVTALFGPSGSGKTTILRAIAGLYTPREAHVSCDGRLWTETAARIDLAPHRRSVGLVFQDYALFPHMTVLQQLICAMDHRPRADRPVRAQELIASVHLDGLASRRPAELSGGQQQRVAIARALARDPGVLLLDEPFASVDRALRAELHRELAMLRKQLRIPVLLVTHDFEDVTRLASRLVLLENGTLVASGRVTDLTASNDLPGYASHREPAVVLDAEVEFHDSSRQLSGVRVASLQLLIPELDLAVGSPVRLQIQAREVILASTPPRGLSLHNAVPVRVLAVEGVAQRGLRLVHLEADSVRLLSIVTADAVKNLSITVNSTLTALIKSASVEAFG